MPKYLDEDGVKHLWAIIRDAIDGNRNGVIVLGDSYGQGYTPNGTITSWVATLTATANLRGYTVYSRSTGGYGFGTGEGADFAANATTLVDTLTDEQKASIGTVIVGGGYNDRKASRADIQAGMQRLQAVIAASLPNVRRVLIFPFGMAVEGLATGTHADFDYDWIPQTITRYVDANAATHIGTVVDNCHMLLRRNSVFSTDYVHPNGNGQYILGSFVSDVFLGDDSSMVAQYFNNNYTPTYTMESTITANSFAPRIYTVGNSFVVKIPTFYVRYSNVSKTFNDSGIVIATFNDAALQKCGEFRIPCIVRVRYGASTPYSYYCIQGYLQFNAGTLQLKAQEINADGNNFLTVANVNELSISPESFVTIDGLYLV